MRALRRTIGTALFLLLPVGCSNIDAASPMAAPAADAVVTGCNEALAGEIGVGELAGNVGDTIDVPITVRGTGPIDAFGVDLEFPEDVLEYVGCEAGDLTAGWIALACQSNRPGSVTVGGFHTTPIPADTFGQLAILRFQIVAASPGGSSFTTSLFTNDIDGYKACGRDPSPVVSATWGSVKASYRSGT
jgi:hypothetical protein